MHAAAADFYNDCGRGRERRGEVERDVGVCVWIGLKDVCWEDEG